MSASFCGNCLSEVSTIPHRAHFWSTQVLAPLNPSSWHQVQICAGNPKTDEISFKSKLKRCGERSTRKVRFKRYGQRRGCKMEPLWISRMNRVWIVNSKNWIFCLARWIGLTLSSREPNDWNSASDVAWTVWFHMGMSKGRKLYDPEVRPWLFSLF